MTIVLLAIVTVGITAGSMWVSRDRPPTTEWQLPSEPMDIEMVDDEHGYLSLADGRILRFTVPTEGGELEWSEAASGLPYPRGLARSGDALFVAVVGPLPCDPPFPYCFAPMLGMDSDVAAELAIIEQSAGQLLRFSIEADGSLSNPTVVIDDLPVVDTEHAVNDVEIGPDGVPYLSVGNVGQLGYDGALYDSIDHENADWLGTILRVDAEPEVVVGGLRNVYGLAFGPDGSLVVVDNDGMSWQGWRIEELIAVEEGADYGFPQEGSFGPFERRTGRAFGTLAGIGAAGIAWIDADTLAVGSCGRLTFIDLMTLDGTWQLRDRPHDDDRVDLGTNNCASSIVPLSANRLLVTTVGDNLLRLLAYDR